MHLHKIIKYKCMYIRTVVMIPEHLETEKKIQDTY